MQKGNIPIKRVLSIYMNKETFLKFVIFYAIIDILNKYEKGGDTPSYSEVIEKALEYGIRYMAMLSKDFIKENRDEIEKIIKEKFPYIDLEDVRNFLNKL